MGLFKDEIKSIWVIFKRYGIEEYIFKNKHYVSKAWAEKMCKQYQDVADRREDGSHFRVLEYKSVTP